MRLSSNWITLALEATLGRTPFLPRLAGVLVVLSTASSAAAQQQDTAQAPDAGRRPGGGAQSSARLEISGVVFANYQHGGPKGNRSQNRFDVERVYLTVLAPAGERVSVRFTSDIFVQRDSTRDQYYRGWTMRAKYAWLQYELMRPRASGASGVVRLGLVHTPIAEYEESFFLRYVSSGALEPAGFFSTADAGVSSFWTLPGRRGELYLAMLNGPGYTSREIDRFKDYGVRFSYTPFAEHGASLWSTLSLTPWYYKGWRASSATGSAGAARQRDRYGVFAGLRDPRLRLGVTLARRVDEMDLSGGSAPVDVVGTVVSGFAVAKPGALARPASPGRLSVILRADRVRPNLDSPGWHALVIGGLQYELSSRAAAAVDLQMLSPRNGSNAVENRTVFLHLVANF
jgi:hypothetical protein